MRRRQRRLRQWLRHERLSVAMALAETQHRTSRGHKKARAGGGVRDAVHGEVPEALLSQEPGTQHFTLDDDDSVPELGGSRPDRLAGVRPQEWVPFFCLCHFSRWTLAGSPRGALHSDGEGDDCMLPGGMSSSRSSRPLPRIRATQLHGDRRWQGPGSGNEQYYTATFRSIPPPRRQALSTFFLTSKMCLPQGRGLTASLASGRRCGFSGPQWTRSSTPRLRCRFLTSMCR